MTAEFERRWENRRKTARTAGDQAKESYYGLPVVHKPHWKWLIIIYFFAGGICGAANAIATLSRWFGGRDGESITRVGRYISFVMVIPSTISLIQDLGRPERFLNMLRVVKIRSPMSVGTWILTVSSLFMSLLTLEQASRDGLLGRNNRVVRIVQGMPIRLFEVLGLLPSLMLAGYTGVLVAATAVPVWAKNYLLMGPLFLASAISNATASIALILSIRGRSGSGALKRLERLDVIAMLAELGLVLLAKRRLGPVIGRPLSEGTTGKLHHYGVLGAGIGLPLLLQGKSVFFGSKPSRLIVGVASALVLIGGFIFRYVMVMAGHQSADDPKATFEMTRDRREALPAQPQSRAIVSPSVAE